jgi:hypothetical protein
MEAKDNRGGKRAGSGRKPGIKSTTLRVPADVAEILKSRFRDTDNPRLREWLDKLP